MIKSINFSSIDIEVGQPVPGLSLSSAKARDYFQSLIKSGLQFIDRGSIVSPIAQEQPKIHTIDDLKRIEWEKYRLAYLKTIDLLNDTIPLLNWGGDHSMALSTVGAFATYFKNEGYVLWIDAHADINLPRSSLTGNFHGMPLSVLLNIENIAKDFFPWLEQTLEPNKLIYLGLRDLDPYETELIKKLNIKTFFYNDIVELGIVNIANEIHEITKGSPLHISFDIDSTNPIYAPSTGVTASDGLTPFDFYILGEQLFRKSLIKSIDIVEVNPAIGNFDQVDLTYLTAFSFVLSIFNDNNPGGLYDDMGQRNQRKYYPQMERSL